MKKIVGIIGGMGPLATCYLLRDMIEKTNAHNDQEHIHICIDCNTNIPDRTEAILHHGPSPVPEIVKSGIKLEGMGANVLVMPCNTAHYFYDDLTSYFDVPLLHMPREAAKTLKEGNIKKVGLIATDGTISVGIYHKALADENIEVVVPEKEHQRYVMNLIYEGIKAGNGGFDEAGIMEVINDLYQKGAQTLLLGCTELPIAFERFGIKEAYIDPSKELAKAAVRYVGAKINS